MVQIVLSPQQLSDTGTQFATKRQELEALGSQARSYVSALQGAWKGNRATPFYTEWSDMDKRIQDAILTLQQASDLLKRASADFTSAHSAF